MRKKEYIGRSVRLRRRIQTEGGDVFDPGTVMKVTQTWRGAFTLEAFDRTESKDGTSSYRPGVKGVRDHDFELLPEAPRECARLAMVAALDLAAGYGLTFELAPGDRRLTADNWIVVDQEENA